MAVSNEMKEHLASGEVTNLACFLKITALDGTVIRVWNGTRNKVVGGETYLAYPLAPSQLQQTNGLNADNMEAVVAYSGLFTSATMRSKKWLGAKVEYAVYDYKNFSLGYAERRTGFIGQTEIGKFAAKPEMRSLSGKLSQPVVLTYQKDCNVVEFTDTRCGVDVNGWTRSGFKIGANGVIAAPILNRQQFSVNFTETNFRGLRARYYETSNFGTLVNDTTTAEINFPLSSTARADNTPAEIFSAKFDGKIIVPASGLWNFKIVHDNGARLTVDGTSLINVWATDGMTTPATSTGSISLTAGTEYSFVADWNNGGGPSEYRMLWSSTTQSEQIIPGSAFKPPSAVTVKNNLYERGKIKFITGNNAGVETQILVNTGNAMTLYLPLYYLPSVGDQIEITVGCNRKLEICRDEFGNAANNRSFFMLAGRNKLYFPE